MMMSSLHPIRLLTRADAEVATVYHSFYVMEYIPAANDLRTIQRIPHERSKMDIIESGLKLFLLEDVELSLKTEIAGNFVVTTSDGSRFFAFFRSFDFRMIVSVSQTPSVSFSRRIFDLLEFEKKDTLPLVLLTLCELPILPAAGMQYDIELTKGTASLNFSPIEQPEDDDIDLIVMSVMNPRMLVLAWESVILERKVVVVSETDSIITACCEFLRRMALPLVVINTYVPLLPLPLINTVEAPFPYLVGANTNMLRENQVDLSDTVIIDLDRQNVVMPKHLASTPASNAPPNLKAKLVREINSINFQPLGAWFQRSTNNKDGWDQARLRNHFDSSKGSKSLVSRATQVLQLFVRTNISLLCSRTCTIKAFSRRKEITLPAVTDGSLNSSNHDLNTPFIQGAMVDHAAALGSSAAAAAAASAICAADAEVLGRDTMYFRKPQILSMGYSLSSEHGVAAGFMQLLKDSFNELYFANPTLMAQATDYTGATTVAAAAAAAQAAAASSNNPNHFVPCWVEQDDLVLYVYEYADDLPLVYIPNSDIITVSSLSREPEGHVFELVTKDQAVYTFTCTDTVSRTQWIGRIEKHILKAHSNQTNQSGTNNSSNGLSGGSSSGGNFNVNTPPTISGSGGRSEGTGSTDNRVTSGKFSFSKDGSSKLTVDVSQDVANSPFSPTDGANTIPNGIASHENNSYGVAPFPDIGLHRPEEAVEGDNVSKEDASFRFYFMKTQMMNSLINQMECPEYESIFKELDVNVKGLINKPALFNEHMNTLLCSSGSVGGLLDNILQHPDIFQEQHRGNSNSSNNNSPARHSDGGVVSELAASDSRRSLGQMSVKAHTLATIKGSKDEVDIDEEGNVNVNDDDDDDYDDLAIDLNRLAVDERLPVVDHHRGARNSIRLSVSNLSIADVVQGARVTVSAKHMVSSPFAADEAAGNQAAEATTSNGGKRNSVNIREYKPGGIFSSIFKRRPKANSDSQQALKAAHAQGIDFNAAGNEWRGGTSSTINNDNNNNNGTNSPMGAPPDTSESLARKAECEEAKSNQLKRARIMMLANIYRRCQSELTTALVSSRSHALADLVETQVISMVKTGKVAPIKLVMAQFLAAYEAGSVTDMHRRRTGPSRAASPLNVVKSNSIDGGIGINSSARMAAFNEEVKGIALSYSHRWHNHMWSALVGQNWDSYKTSVKEATAAQALARTAAAAAAVATATTGAGITTTEGEGDDDVGERPPLATAEESNVLDELYSGVTLTQEEIEEKNVSSIRLNILAYFTNCLDQSAIAPGKTAVAQMKFVYAALEGYMYEEMGMYSDALTSYAYSGCLVNMQHIMKCLVCEMATIAADPELIFNESKFLRWARELSPVVGIQAYRLLIEILYIDAIESLNANSWGIEQALQLGSFRSFPGGRRAVTTNVVRMDRDQQGGGSLKGGGNKGGAGSGLVNATMSANGEFSWYETQTKSEVLNEHVICAQLHNGTHPCDLSAQLLTRLKEILRNYCQSAGGSRQYKKSPNGTVRLKISDAMVAELNSSSTFRAFELASSQLQKVNLRGMTIDERVMFFCNAFNTLTVHAIILRGAPGLNLLERSSFMRNSKYNLGGHVYSLLDIEHGILRHASTKPMIFGPLTISVTFPEKDPRREFVLDQPRPHVSFVLFQASASSPALVTLKDKETIEQDLKRHARRYFLDHVKMDPVQKSIELPGLIRVYWTDFGGHRVKVLRLIKHLVSGTQLATDLKPFVDPDTAAAKPKVEFAPIDWRPMFIL